MPHVALVPFTGFRLREEEMRALGMSLPGLTQRAGAIAQLPALGLLTLAGLNPPHWECSYHETPAWDEEFITSLREAKPDLVAVSALTASVHEAYAFSRAARRQGLKTVLGGLHATVCPDEASQHFDAVVIGEGEPVWPQVLRDVEAGCLQPIYRNRGMLDLAASPVPRFDLLGSKTRPRLTVQTQRGCPLACEFCAASRLLGSFREKPVANLRRELAAIRAQVPRPVLELADDNTFAGRREPEPFFEVLAESKARYFTEVDWRIGEQPRVLEGLAGSGCVQVLVGIESLVFRHPGMGPKQAELQRILAALAAIQEAGVAVIGCFIVGCDGETRHSLDRLAEFILESPLADVQLTLQTSFPGTALYQRLQLAGRLLAGRSWPYYTLFDVTYQPDQMSVEELETGFREVIRTVFSESATARRAGIRRRTWHRNPRLHSWASPPSSAT